MELAFKAELLSHLAELTEVVPADKCDGNSALTCATGATRAMHIVLRLARRIKVDHLGDSIDMDPSRSDISGYERCYAPTLEISQCPLALPLTLVAVHRNSLNPSRIQTLDKLVRAALGADEHKVQFPTIAKFSDQSTNALIPLNGNEAMLNVRLLLCRSNMLMANRVACVELGDLASLAVKRC